MGGSKKNSTGEQPTWLGLDRREGDPEEPRLACWTLEHKHRVRKHVGGVSATQLAPPLGRKPRPPGLGRLGSPAVGVIVQPEPLDERVSCSSE